MNRRDFLAQSVLVPAAFGAWVEAIQEDLWSTASAILARIKPPTFPARDVDLLTPRRERRRRQRLHRRVPRRHRSLPQRRRRPGGRSRRPVPDRRDPSALECQPARPEGATIAFRPDAAAYLPLVLTRFEGVELMNYSPFVYALDETNVADHRARHARRPGQRAALVVVAARPGRPRATELIQMAADGVPPDETRVRRGDVAVCGRTSSSPIAARTCSSKA